MGEIELPEYGHCRVKIGGGGEVLVQVSSTSKGPQSCGSESIRNHTHTYFALSAAPEGPEPARFSTDD